MNENQFYTMISGEKHWGVRERRASRSAQYDGTLIPFDRGPAGEYGRSLTSPRANLFLPVTPCPLDDDGAADGDGGGLLRGQISGLPQRQGCRLYAGIRLGVNGIIHRFGQVSAGCRRSMPPHQDIIRVAQFPGEGGTKFLVCNHEVGGDTEFIADFEDWRAGTEKAACMAGSAQRLIFHDAERDDAG